MRKHSFVRSVVVTAGALLLSLVAVSQAAAATTSTAPTMIAPANNYSLTSPYNGSTYYSWTAVAGAINYHFQLDYFNTSTNAWTSVFDYNRGNYTSNYTMMYNKEGSWRVRVKALFADGTETAYSSYNNFSYAITPTVTLLKLAATTLTTPVVQSVVVGSNGFAFAKFELNASSSQEDVKVTSLTITDVVTSSGAAYTDIANLGLYDSNGNRLATSSSTAVNANKVTFSFTTPVLVSRLTPVVLTLKGDVVARSTVNVETHTFYIANVSNQITAYGQTSGNAVAYSSETISGLGQGMTVAPAGTLTLSLVSGVSASPSTDQTVIVNTKNVPVFAFKITAQNEAQKITSLKLYATAVGFNYGGVTGTLKQSDVVNLRLYRNNEIVPFAQGNQMSCANNICTFTWTATDNLLADPVQPGSPVTVYVRADISPAGTAQLGDSFSFLLTESDVTARGAYSATPAVVSGNAIAVGNTFIMPFPVMVTGDAPASGSAQTQAVINGTQIARFKVTNYGTSQISIVSPFALTNSGFITGSTTKYSLSYSGENMTNYTANTATSSDSSVFLNFKPVAINGGSYRYFTVSIANIGTAKTGDSWSFGIPVLGYVKYSVSETNLGYDGNGNGNILDTINLFADGKPQLGTIVKQ